MPRTAAAVALIVVGILLAAGVVPATPLVLGLLIAGVGVALLA